MTRTSLRYAVAGALALLVLAAILLYHRPFGTPSPDGAPRTRPTRRGVTPDPSRPASGTTASPCPSCTVTTDPVTRVPAKARHQTLRTPPAALARQAMRAASARPVKAAPRAKHSPFARLAKRSTAGIAKLKDTPTGHLERPAPHRLAKRLLGAPVGLPRAAPRSPERAARQSCGELGIATPAPNCDAYEKLLAGLRKAPFFYNKPARMTAGEAVEVDLALNPSDPAGARALLHGLHGTTARGESPIARHMSAQLFGAAFEVSPAGPQRRIVLTSNTTTWQWKVTPRAPGEKLLTLSVYVHLEVDGKSSPPIAIRTYRDRIRVEVSRWRVLAAATEYWSPILGFVVALTGALWGAWRWLRRRGWKA